MKFFSERGMKENKLHGMSIKGMRKSGVFIRTPLNKKKGLSNLRLASVLEVHTDNGSTLMLPLWWYPTKQLKRNKDTRWRN